MLEDVYALTIKVGVEGSANLVQSLFGLPFVLSNQDLVMLSVQTEELFLIVVAHLANINVWPLSMVSELEHARFFLHLDQVSPSWILHCFVNFKRVILPGLVIVIHLNTRVVLFN